MATTTIKLKHRDLRIAMEAVSTLAQRRLKDINTELRVGKLVKALRADFQDTEVARDKIARDHPTPDSWDNPTPPLPVEEKRLLDFNDFLEQEVEVTVPEHWLITTDMLPVETKIDPSNRNGIAAIVANLGPFFVGVETDAPTED